ncbi:MAG: DUF4124 domain-containing protein [Gammaproteobacteria bacterium]|nr:DUF4124 domain-containing protein [Gammaproteobacteria bacterium]
MTRHPPPLFAAVLATALAAPVGAVTVHTWVDEQGVTHFADAPPGGAQPSNEVEVDEGPMDARAEDDYYSIVNQWQRLRAEREAQDALALERDRLDAERAPSPPVAPTPAPEDDPMFLSPYYGFGAGRYPGHHHHPPPLEDYSGPPSPPGSFVNIKPPTWPSRR